MSQKTIFDPVIAPRIVNDAIGVYDKTHKKETEVRAANIAARTKANNMLLDAMYIACDKPKDIFTKGNAATNPALAQVKAFFDACVERGTLEKSTADSYRSGFWYAFDQGISWSADLNNKKTEAKKTAQAPTAQAPTAQAPTSQAPTAQAPTAQPPTAQAPTADPRHAGKPSVINVPELHRSISLVLAQSRALNQKAYADKLLEWTLGTWPDFKESVLKK
jgi:hypothetical protein